MAQSRGSIIERTLIAVNFIQRRKYWTIKDLSEELGINKKNGREYLAYLSLHLPIVEHKQGFFGMPGIGPTPSIYTLMDKNER